MDLALPRLKKPDDGATPNTKPWPVAFSPPASPTSVNGGNRTRSPSPCVDLNALSSDDSEVDVTPQDFKVTLLRQLLCRLTAYRRAVLKICRRKEAYSTCRRTCRGSACGRLGSACNYQISHSLRLRPTADSMTRSSEHRSLSLSVIRCRGWIPR